MRIIASLLLSATLVAASPLGAWQTPAAPPQRPAPAVAWPDWLAALRAEARTRGISEATLDAALTTLTPDSTVLDRENAQPEVTQSLETYVELRLSKKTRLAAQTMADTHQPLLEQIRQAYGIPMAIMISIWGIESNFGAITGTRSTIASLATLAYDGRRPALFRSELLQALAIVDRGPITAADLKGSWAGAMGQPQFLPSSYLKFAVDFDADGRADIWSSVPDVFASIANYLKSSGWTDSERWGREVRVTGAALARIDKRVPKRTAGCGAVRDLSVPRSLDDWTAVGVTQVDGDPLPASAILKASLVRGQHRYFLVHHNYEALLAYNCSNSYAISVGLLADTIEIKGSGGPR